MWIKICGISSIEDAETAIAAGADAIGFVFAESPRRITREAAREIIRRLPQSVEKIGVFVDAAPEEVVATYEIAGLTGLQLHGSARADSRGFPAGVGEHHTYPRVLSVVRYSGDPEGFDLELRKLHESRSGGDRSSAVLVDTCVAGKQGGTGRAFDWRSARESFLRDALHLRLIAAGGLCRENVREAIQTLRPWGVDVSSGVESSPGRKDASRVAEFIRIAREAEVEFGITAEV